MTERSGDTRSNPGEDLALTALMCAWQDPESITVEGFLWQDPESITIEVLIYRTQSPSPLEGLIWPSPPNTKTLGTISGKKILAGPAQKSETLISFLKHLQLFCMWHKLGSFRLRLRWAQTTFPCTMTDVLRPSMATGLGGNTCFPQARAHSYRHFVPSPQPQKPESYFYEKLTFFICRVSLSKSSSLHRAHVAAPSSLLKSTVFYPKIVGTWWFGSAGAARQVSAVHTTAAFISSPWVCGSGYEDMRCPHCAVKYCCLLELEICTFTGIWAGREVRQS